MAQAPSHRLSTQVLYTPADLFPGRKLLLRLALVLTLLGGLILLLWLDREGLRDQVDGDISFADVVYFAMVTITTVGYGDIVPVTPRARLIDALIVTPVRLFVWFLFLGTAYQLIVRQYMEGYRMAKMQAQLAQHVIVCGFGNTGFAAVKELLAKGLAPEQVVVVDGSDERVRSAVEHGVVAIRGDAAQESVLKDAVIERAKAVIIAAGRDDTNALILLTARHLTKSARMIVSAKQDENVKLFRQGGADAIISPATFGGYALAAAVDHAHLPQYLEDLLTAGGRVQLIERTISAGEAGRTAADFRPDVLLRVYRGETILSLWDLQDGQRLRAGDTIVLIESTQDTTGQR